MLNYGEQMISFTEDLHHMSSYRSLAAPPDDLFAGIPISNDFVLNYRHLRFDLRHIIV